VSTRPPPRPPTPPKKSSVFSTTTKVGRTKAQELFPDKAVFYYPLDFSWTINRALDRIRPDAIVLLELEIWPNFIHQAHRRHIPVVVLNGRLTERGLLGHRRFGFVMRPAYRKIAGFGAQSETYAERFKSLGVDPNKIKITGTMKYDTVTTFPFDCHDNELAASLGLSGMRVLVAGSTHGHEEERRRHDHLHARAGRRPRFRLDG
jgi:3-deoxy-D-manno-octulosonic-acid transferase